MASASAVQKTDAKNSCDFWLADKSAPEQAFVVQLFISGLWRRSECELVRPTCRPPEAPLMDMQKGLHLMQANRRHEVL